MKSDKFAPEEQSQVVKIMFSILKNDWVLQRKMLLAMIAIAVVSAIVLKLAGIFDNLSIFVLLFGIEAPLLAYVLADRSLAIENENKSLGFISRLPLNNSQMLIVKECSLLIFTVALYLIFGAIAFVLTGTDFFGLVKEAFNNSGFVFLPIFAVVYGMFTSMLPRGTGLIASAILVMVALFFFNDLDSIANANYFLLMLLFILVLNCISLLIISKFEGEKLQVSATKGIGYLLIGVGIIAAVWNLVSLYAENSINMDFSKGGSWVPVDGGKKIIWSLYSKPATFFETIDMKSEYYNSEPEDVLKALERSFGEIKSAKRLFVQDLENGSVMPVASRYSCLPIMSGNESSVNYNNFVEAYAEKIEFGFSKGSKRTIISKKGNIVKTLSPVFGNSENRFRAVDEKSFLYREDVGTKENYASEYFVYSAEKGARKILSLSKEDYFNDWVVAPKKNDGSQKTFILAALKGDSNKLTMISTENQAKTLLPLTENALLKAVASEFMVFDDGHWNSQMIKEEKNILVKYDGTYEELSWLGDNARVKGVSSSGKIIAALPFNGGRDKGNNGIVAIVEGDPETRTVKDIYRSDSPFLCLMAMSDKGDYALFHAFKRGKGQGTYTFAVNLFEGKIVDFGELSQGANKNGLSIGNGPFKLSGSKFMVGGSLKGEDYNGIIELDAEKGSIRRVVSYKYVSALIK